MEHPNMARLVATLLVGTCIYGTACTDSHGIGETDGGTAVVHRDASDIGVDRPLIGRPDTGVLLRDTGVVAPDAGPNIDPEPCYDVRKVDLLFMIDNSNSMSEEQALLAAQLPRLVTALSTGDRDGDGARDFVPVRDLHVGVVTSDLGNGGYFVPTCTSELGDDGVLVTRGSRMAGCELIYPSFLGFMPEAPGADVEAFAQRVQCVATAGTTGCGFEQPLDAILKAVTPSTSPVRFTNGTLGHGDTTNAGFLRNDSVVSFVLLSDEDDCSTSDPELFASSPGSRYTGDLNLRCLKYPSVPHDLTRYTDLTRGLRALRPSRPDLVLFSVIAGVPVDLVADPHGIDYDRLLADPRMQEREETVMVGGATMGTGLLVPACNTGHGRATPARRLVQVARAFGEGGVVQSICQSDFGPALRAITDKLAASVGTEPTCTR